ncbi:hypothetical protein [Motiliproteus sp. MSK22-1]|uniref:hypothetical protein n=1 Tax=Motiliproteus sp. MSK22-1 TaxID=1897630 RepID=UPI0009780C36|nr:hypothetical protein [Motiliproteus sp. MSK22-1]OMH33595.1 hypothetical protein BGP75_11240 [Motiliproteus sp. MSK22-1]
MDKSQYFYRTVVITRKNNQVALANIDNPQETTALDDWLGVVISLADGAHNIEELIGYLRGHYPNSPPQDLEKTIESVIDRLSDGKLIKFSEEPVSLPYYLSFPVEELDIDKAKKLMQEDGYTQH